MSTRQLLVGDVVLLEAGDKIPADGVLTQGDDVSVNESSLTGEAEDVRKGAGGGGEDAFLLSGCTLTSGRATMMAIAVGAESRWGRIKVGGGGGGGGSVVCFCCFCCRCRCRCLHIVFVFCALFLWSAGYII